jgi:uncharacterized DUF497 family protein
MRIVWDEPKRLANIIKHGIDFASIDETFFTTALIRPSKAERFVAIGELGGMITVIFLRLGSEGLSIISARPASARERRMWHA